jgi:SAM-dependent methyltransferase
MNAFSSAKLVRFSPKILFRRAWMKYVVQASKLHYADDHARHDLAYTVEDPWSLASDLERHRFDRTADAINRRIGAVETVLEIGSAEGHHTRRLLEQCHFVDCIECSARAIVRAKARCPRARFFQASFPDLPHGLRPRYDLVIAAESLYYIADVQAAIDQMNELGRFCLVTFHEGNSDRLKAVFERIAGATFECIEHPVCNWNLYIWESTKASLPT